MNRVDMLQRAREFLERNATRIATNPEHAAVSLAVVFESIRTEALQDAQRLADYVRSLEVQ